jgi:galactose oxidase-like protein
VLRLQHLPGSIGILALLVLLCMSSSRANAVDCSACPPVTGFQASLACVNSRLNVQLTWQSDCAAYHANLIWRYHGDSNWNPLATNVTAYEFHTPTLDAWSGYDVDFKLSYYHTVYTSCSGEVNITAHFPQLPTKPVVSATVDSDGTVRVNWGPHYDYVSPVEIWARIYRDQETSYFVSRPWHDDYYEFQEPCCGSHTYSVAMYVKDPNNGIDCQADKGTTSSVGYGFESVLLSPPNGTLDAPCSILCSWKAACSATTYTLQVAQNPEFNPMLYSSTFSAVFTQAVIPVNTQPGVIHYWRVQPCNPSGCVDISQCPVWTYYRPKVSAPGSLTATGDQVKRVVIKWLDVAGDEGYRIYRDGVLIQTLAANETGYVDQNVPPGTYTYCVRAIDACEGWDGNEACVSGTSLEYDTTTPPPGPTAAWSTLGISARMDAAMLYDPDADRFVLFGGTDGVQTFGDALQLFPGYYNDTWQPIAVSSTLDRPAERSGHTIIYDRTQRRLVLFGGKDRIGNYFNDVWVFPLWTKDGNGVWQPYYGSWQRLMPGGIAVPGLVDHTAVLDTQENRMLVYGGKTQSGVISDQLYALDFQTLTWYALDISSATITGPFGRHKHVAIYDTDFDAIFVFGGEQYHNGTTMLASSALWRLRLGQHPLQWDQFLPQVGGSPAGVNGGAVYDVSRDEMVIYGGNVPGSPASSTIYRVPLEIPSGYQTLSLSTSLRRESFAHAYDSSSRSRMWIFGGSEGNNSLLVGPLARNDTWSLALGTSPQWISTNVRPYAGTWARDMTLVYDDQHARTIMFGGNTGVSGASSATLVLGLAGYPDQWAVPNVTGVLVNNRYDHSAIYDRSGDQMVIYGGKNEYGELSDLRALKRLGGQDLSSNDYQWVTLPNTGGPGLLSGHSAVYADISPTNRKMLIFGGRSGTSLQSKLWSYDLIANTWQPVTTSGSRPIARADHAAVYDYTSKKMFIFGGVTFDGATDEVFFLDVLTNKWTKAQFTGPRPAPRSNMSLVLSPYADARMIVYGGDSEGGVLRGDAWSVRVWDIPYGTSWSQLPTWGTATPGERQGHAAVYTNAGHMIMFGGVWQNPSSTLDEHYNDTWNMYYNIGGFASVQARPAGDPDSPLAESAPARKLALDIERVSRSQVLMRLSLEEPDSSPGGAYQLSVYDVAGRLRHQFHSEELVNGSQIVWDMTDDRGSHLPAGIYFIRLKGPKSTITQRIVALH